MLMELIMFAITIALFFAVIHHFKDKNKFGLVYSLLAFGTFLAIDFIILKEWMA